MSNPINQQRAAKPPHQSKHLFALIGLGLAATWFFRDVIIRGEILWGTDFISTYLPYKQFLYEEARQHGSIPLWNPYLFGGMPFWAYFESTIFYPLDLLFWLVSPETAYGYTIAFHILLAGISMYALCQSLHLSKTGSLLAAVVFSYNGFIMPFIYLGHMVLVQSYSWTPLILCLFARSFESTRPATAAVWAGLCWGLQILAADPQTAFYTYGALVLFALLQFKALSSCDRFLGAAKILGVVFAVGAGIAAVQMVPASELVRLSTRRALKSYDMVTLGSFPPEGIVTLLMPHFFGNLPADNFWVDDMPFTFPGHNLYAGVLSLLFVFFVRYRRSDQARLVWFCVILAIASLILAMGRHTPVYRLVYLIPGFDSFRAPSKIIVLWSLAISLLAAKGLDDLACGQHQRPSWKWVVVMTGMALCLLLDAWFYRHPEETLKWFSPFLLNPKSPMSLSQASRMIYAQFHTMVILAAIGSAAVYLGLRGVMRRTTWLVFSVLFVLTDLAVLNSRHIRGSDIDYSKVRTIKAQLAQAFKDDTGVFRVGGLKAYFGPNMEMYYGLQSVTGAGPLILSRYYSYCNQFYGKVASKGWQVLRYGTPGSGKFMDMLNVKYEIDYEAKTFSMRESFLPRAFLVSDYKVMPADEILSYMETDDFDPRKTVILEKLPLQERSNNQDPGTAHNGTGTCEILSYRPDTIQIRTACKQSAFLVLNDVYYPGWKCYVNGIPQEILRCNYLFRGIRLPQGIHEVRFSFEPHLVMLGATISIATIILLCIVALRGAKIRLRDHVRKDSPLLL